MNVKTLSIAAGLIAALGSTAALAADEYTLNRNMPSAVVSTSAASTPRTAVRVARVDEYQRNQNQAVAATPGLQRAQVVAEAIEARKLGLIGAGELSAPAPTAAQREQIRLAGLRAVNTQFAGK